MRPAKRVGSNVFCTPTRPGWQPTPQIVHWSDRLRACSASSSERVAAKMSDPKDLGKTAIAFMPLYQAAQAKARGGKEPCTLEFYAKVHAEMGLLKDATGAKMNHHLVLAQNGTHHQAWLECEGYWTPIVGAPTILGAPNPKFKPEMQRKFAELNQKEADRILGIKR